MPSLTCWSKSFQTVTFGHGLRPPREEIAFTARPKIHSHLQIFRYSQSIFCLPHRPNFSDIFDLCLHWVSVVRVFGRPIGTNGMYDTLLESSRKMRNTWKSCFDNFWTKMPKNGHFDICCGECRRNYG